MKEVEQTLASSYREVNNGSRIRATVYFVPVSSENPYQRQLADELRLHCVEVCSSTTLEEILRKSRSTKQYRVLHLHWLPTFRGGLRRIAGFTLHLLRIWLISRRGCRVIWTAHNVYAHESKSKRADWLFTAAICWICKAVIVHSPRAAAAIAKEFLRGDTRRIRVIPHGNYINAYPNTINRADARKALSIPENRLVIGCVGNLRPYKGLDRLMRLLGAIPNPEVLLLIAGSTFDDAYTEQLSIFANRDPRIILHPRYLRDDEMQIYFNAADIVAFPYRAILTSGAVLLAMSFGRACLVPRLGSIPDYVDESCGVFFDSESDEGLRLGLERVIARRNRLAQMGACAFRRTSKWNWRDIALATMSAYGIPLERREAERMNAACRDWWHDDPVGAR